MLNCIYIYFLSLTSPNRVPEIPLKAKDDPKPVGLITLLKVLQPTDEAQFSKSLLVLQMGQGTGLF
jgi:hypothetical protein